MVWRITADLTDFRPDRFLLFIGFVLVIVRDVNKARDMQGQGHRPKANIKAKAKAKNANVNCWENATVNLSILSHFRYSLEKLH